MTTLLTDSARLAFDEDARSPWLDDPDIGWAVVAHPLTMFAGPFVPWMALVIAGRRSVFVRQHARQALNFLFNMTAIIIFGMAGVLNGFTICSLPVAVALTAVWIWPLFAARQAARGAWDTYPQLIPFLRSIPEPIVR